MFGPVYILISLFEFARHRTRFAFNSILPFPAHLGRLAVIKEGAGKNRVVAMTDWWTQCAFKGLHKSLFDMLRRIPQDGTFDQFAPVEANVLPYRHGEK